MIESSRTLAADEAREADYALQKIRFSFVTMVVLCWLAALLVAFVAPERLVAVIVAATLITAGDALVWTFGLKGARDSLASFTDPTTGKLDIPGGRNRLPIPDGLRMIFWDKRETKVMTVGIGGSFVLAALWLLLGTPQL